MKDKVTQCVAAGDARLKHDQICVQLPTYADSVALPAFAHYTPLLQQLFGISCPPGPQQQTWVQ